MRPIHEARLKLRGELEAPPALRKFGRGWISGVLGLVFGVAGLALVLSLRASGLFSMPETRGLHGHIGFRFGLHALLLTAFGLSAISLVLRLSKTLGTYFLPKDRWPSGYGVQGHPVPKGYVAQWKYPFQRNQ